MIQTVLRKKRSLDARILRPIRRRVSGVARRSGLRTPVVLLINDCRDQENYGAEILVDAMDPILKEALPGYEIDYIPSGWLLDISSGTGAFKNGGSLHQPECRWPRVADQFEHVAHLWERGQGGSGVAAFLEKLDRADLVILNGEGSIYRTNLSAIRELFLAWFAKARLGVPALFVNGMVHLADVVPTLNAMVRKTFRVLDAVSVREPFSLRNLQHYAPEVAATWIPDSAFYLTRSVAENAYLPEEVRHQLNGAPFFCMDPGPMPIDHEFGERSALPELILRLKKLVGQAVLVESAPEDRFMRKVAEDTGSVFMGPQKSYRALAGLAAEAKFQVTGRYHNPLIAAMVGTPSISWGTSSHKVHGACEVLEGLNGTPFDGTDLRLCMDAIVERARMYLADDGTLRKKLRELSLRHAEATRKIGALVSAAARR